MAWKEFGWCTASPVACGHASVGGRQNLVGDKNGPSEGLLPARRRGRACASGVSSGPHVLNDRGGHRTRVTAACPVPTHMHTYMHTYMHTHTHMHEIERWLLMEGRWNMPPPWGARAPHRRPGRAPRPNAAALRVAVHAVAATHLHARLRCAAGRDCRPRPHQL